MVKYIRTTYSEHGSGYLVMVTAELAKGRGEYITVRAYPASARPLEITEEGERGVRVLGDGVLSILAPPGGMVKVELQKLVSSGYRRRVAETTEELNDEVRKFLEELLGKPTSCSTR